MAKKVKRGKPRVKISQELRDIINGYIMSDGYVNSRGNLTVNQGLKQKNFVEWLYNVLAPLRTNHPISIVERLDLRTNKISKSARFNTLNCLIGFRSMWYTKVITLSGGKITYKKALPKSIPCFFSPLFITVWYAGDGTKIIGSKGVKFEVSAFTPEERLILKNLFKTKYGISSLINRQGVSSSGNEQWALCINAEDYPKFKKLITQIDLITKLFPHKLH